MSERLVRTASHWGAYWARVRDGRVVGVTPFEKDEHPSPLAQSLADEGFRIISGGTDTHLMLVDVFSKGMLGSEAEKALGEAGITVNKNAIPFDTNPPLKPSGIRIGTPALTTRGMKENEMRQIGRWIAEALLHRTEAAVLSKVRSQVLELCEAFPLYADRRAKAQAEVRA